MGKLPPKLLISLIKREEINNSSAYVAELRAELNKLIPAKPVARLEKDY